MKLKYFFVALLCACSLQGYSQYFVYIFGLNSTANKSLCKNSKTYYTGRDNTGSAILTGGTWSSGNTSVATVGYTSGIVTAIDAGTAVISYAYSTYSATVTVTVSSTVGPGDITAKTCHGGTIPADYYATCSPSGGAWSNLLGGISVNSSTGKLTASSTTTGVLKYAVSGCSTEGPATSYETPGIAYTHRTCVGASVTYPVPIYSNSVAATGGTWSSSNTSVGVIDASAGVLTGVSAGTMYVSYQTTDGCFVSTYFNNSGHTVFTTIDAAPAPITGNTNICLGNTTALSCSTIVAGAYWATSGVATIASSTSNNASVGTSGTGTGTAIVTYVTQSTTSQYCAVTTTVTVYEPTITGPSSVAVAGTITLTGGTSPTVSASGSWSSSTPAVATIDGSGVVTGVSPGTTTITYAITGACYATKTVEVCGSFVTSICEVSPIKTCDGVISYCPALDLAIYGGHTGYTYNWASSPHDLDAYSTLSMDGDVAHFTFSSAPPAGINTYTVTVSTSYGCSSTASVTMVTAGSPDCYPCAHFKPCANNECTDCDTVRYFRTITAATLNSSSISTTVAGNYYVPQRAGNVVTLDVSPAAGSLFFVGEDVLLTEYYHDTLDSLHFFSSLDCPWQGIEVVNNSSYVGQLTIKNNTLIEHADVAGVRVKGPSGATAYVPGVGNIVNSDEAIYNRNAIGIILRSFDLGSAYTSDYPFEFRKSIFTARDFCEYYDGESATATNQYPFKWPTADYLKTPTVAESGLNPDFNVDQFPAFPAALVGGIKLDSVGYTDSSAEGYGYYGVVIGDQTTECNTNMFDTLGIGVRATNANVTFYNNIFRRNPFLSSYITNGETAGILGELNAHLGKKRALKLLHGETGRTNNRFYNCHYGFLGKDWYSFTSNGSEMNSDLIIDTNIEGMMNYGIRFRTSIANRYFGSHVIHQNTMTNIVRSIEADLDGCNNPTSTVSITNNTISDATILSASAAGGRGIYVSEFTYCTSSVVGSNLLIEDNHITGSANNILVTGDDGPSPDIYSSFNTTINRNTVVLTRPGSYATGAVVRRGIVCHYANNVSDITNNHVYGDTTLGFAYNLPIVTTSGHVGIELHRAFNTTSERVNLGCNYVHDMPTGFRFTQNNAANWHDNVMARNRYGMLLYEEDGVLGEIGDQGGVCDPMDNIWYDDGLGISGWPGWSDPSVAQTYMRGTNPVNSKLYVRDVTTGAYIYKPANNDYETHGSYTGVYSVPSTIIDAATGCEGPLSDSAVCAPTFVEEGGGEARYATVPSGNRAADIFDSYSVFPNPGDGNVIIKQSVAIDVRVDVKVLNYSGAVVYKSDLKFVNGLSNLNIGKVVPGMYMVVLTDKRGERSSFKVVVQ